MRIFDFFLLTFLIKDIASYNGPLQAKVARGAGGDFAYAPPLVGGAVAAALIVVIRVSPEKRGEVLQAH